MTTTLNNSVLKVVHTTPKNRVVTDHYCPNWAKGVYYVKRYDQHNH